MKRALLALDFESASHEQWIKHCLQIWETPSDNLDLKASAVDRAVVLVRSLLIILLSYGFTLICSLFRDMCFGNAEKENITGTTWTRLSRMS
jgi:hypothetical protein